AKRELRVHEQRAVDRRRVRDQARRAEDAVAVEVRFWVLHGKRAEPGGGVVREAEGRAVRGRARRADLCLRTAGEREVVVELQISLREEVEQPRQWSEERRGDVEAREFGEVARALHRAGELDGATDAGARIDRVAEPE